jgi:hypothetical protein
MKLRQFLITAVLVVGAVLAGGPAHAEVVHDTVTPATYTGPAQQLKAYEIATINFSVASGQRIYVYGDLQAGNASRHSLVDISVTCAVGSSIGGKVVHGENIGAGAQSSVSLVGRMLVTAPYAGPMYCRMYVWVASLTPAGSSTVQVTGGELKIGRRSVPGGVQATSNNQVTTTSKAVWTPVIPGSATAGSVTGLWVPPADASSLTVMGDLSLTKCRTGDEYGCPSSSPTTDSKVSTTLFVTQFNASGTVCKTSTYTASTTISDLRRHDVTYTALTVPIQSLGTCVRKFSIYLKTQVTSGGAVATHGAATAGAMGVLFVLPT